MVEIREGGWGEGDRRWRIREVEVHCGREQGSPQMPQDNAPLKGLFLRFPLYLHCPFHIGPWATWQGKYLIHLRKPHSS